MKLSLSRILFGADRWVDYFYTLDTFDWPSIQCGYPPVGGPSCPGTFIEQADFRFVANSTTNSLVDPDLKPMKTQELTFGMDHELTRTMSLGVRYSHKWLNRHDRSVRRAAAGRRRDLMIANPGFGCGRHAGGHLPELRGAAAGEARLRRRRGASAQAFHNGRLRRRATPTAACSATTPASRTRTRTAASHRTSTGFSTASICRLMKAVNRHTVVSRPIAPPPWSSNFRGMYELPVGHRGGRRAVRGRRARPCRATSR